MNVQVIMRDGEPEYAVLPWAEYQALLDAVGRGKEAARPADDETQAAPQWPELAQLPRLRQAKNFSLEALARTVGISPAYLELIESGERDPDSAIRRALARALDIPGWSGDR